MQFPGQQGAGSGKTARARSPVSLNEARVCIFVAAMAVSMGLAMVGQQQMPPRLPRRPLPDANRLPDANEQMEMREKQTEKRNFEAANAERRKQIAEDSAKLLKLATDLKAEADMNTKGTLSLNVIRRADAIEKLAHNVKEKMKLTVGGT